MDLQRADAGRQIDDAGEGFGFDGLANGLHQRVDAEAQAEVEHDGAVFDEEISIAGAPIDDARLVAGSLAEADDAIVGAELGVGHLRRRNGFERRDLCVLPRQAQRGLRRREAREADFVAGAKLAHLPQLGLRDGGRADEAAKRRAVGAEDDRHVAGEIDGADGVRIVVDVARMQPCFAAVLARPDGLRADEADAGRVRIVVNLPLGGEERVDVVRREEIRRAMRAVEHADVPGMGEARLQCGGERGNLAMRRRSPRRYAARRRRGASRPAWPPKLPRVKVERLPR